MRFLSARSTESCRMAPKWSLPPQSKAGKMDGIKTKGLLYEGKAKKIFMTDNPNELIQYFKDDATAFNAQKRGTIKGKGMVNNRVSEQLFILLEKNGLPTHFIECLDDRSMLVKKLEMFKVEVVVRNIATGSLVKRLGVAEGTTYSPPVVELYYKDDDLGDPLMSDDHVRILNIASPDQLDIMRTNAVRINDILRLFFDERGMVLVDFKLEFGASGQDILLGDEIGPDTCRFWDKATGESMDKDRFRKDLGNIEEAYQEVYRRVCQSS